MSKMYKNPKYETTTLEVNESYVGEAIEDKVARIMNNKEGITDGAPLIYSERSEGIAPEFDIRTDRFEIAVEAMDKVSKSHVAARANKGKVVKMEEKEAKKEPKTETGGDGGAEPTQGTK